MAQGVKNPYKGQSNLKLNVGCGADIKPDFINIDMNTKCDLKLDLEDAKLPFDNGSVDLIYVSHVLEHIHNLLPLMNEFHRVLARGGKLEVHVPVYPSICAFQDPTHVRFFTSRTLLYWHEHDFLWADAGKLYGIKPFTHFNQRVAADTLMAVLIK